MSTTLVMLILLFCLKVRESVSRYGVDRTQQYLSTSPAEMSYVAQMPKTVSTLTDLRKLYLRPGVDMRKAGEHPQNLLNPREPAHGTATTTIHWLPGKSTIMDVTETYIQKY